MGPEPLSNSFSAPDLYARLSHKKTAIKQALLDQSIVAGLGNIYVCEALFGASINPCRPACSLTQQDSEILAQHIRDVLKKAIQAGGSSLKDFRRTNGELGYFQHRFSVYDKENQPCVDCECDIENTGGVRRIIQSGRSTFYCPQKQQ